MRDCLYVMLQSTIHRQWNGPGQCIFPENLTTKGAVIFNAGYRDGRIFGGVSIFLPCDIGLPNNFPFHDGVSKIFAKKVLILEL